MTRLLIVTMMLMSEAAFARVDARFLSFIGMISVTDRVMGEVTDDDPQRLHAAMNVDEKESGGRRAKVIKLADKKFSLLCSDQGGGAMVCSVTVKQGSQGIVSPSKGVIRFVALGQEAREIQKLFKMNPGSDRFDYFSADQSLRISSDADSFLAEYLKR